MSEMDRGWEGALRRTDASFFADSQPSRAPLPHPARTARRSRSPLLPSSLPSRNGSSRTLPSFSCSCAGTSIRAAEPAAMDLYPWSNIEPHPALHDPTQPDPFPARVPAASTRTHFGSAGWTTS